MTFSGDLEKTTSTPCAVGGQAATCLDLYFADPTVSSAQAAPDQPKQQASIDQAERAKAELAAASSDDAPDAPAAQLAGPSEAPGLRETSAERLHAFAKLSPPERLAPPEIPILAKIQPIEESITVGTPTLRQTEPLVAPVKADYAARVEILLDKKLSTAYCNNAAATLQADAWALGAMVDMGLCAAARGDVVEGESILSRLLEYTPDNYEALVGRALIAEYAGERGAALRYYQDALDAPPPVEESTRIVEAMALLASG